VFPIQIGSDLFRLSGASISSDGMSHHRFCEPEDQAKLCVYSSVVLHPVLRGTNTAE
jgi:hypothetical protein